MLDQRSLRAIEAGVTLPLPTHSVQGDTTAP
jgi:hypothetical protein